MKLPGLPLELWTNKAITDITNTIGNLYYLDDRCLGDKNKHTTRVLIENDFTGGASRMHWLILGAMLTKENHWFLGSALHMPPLSWDETPNVWLSRSIWPKFPLTTGYCWWKARQIQSKQYHNSWKHRLSHTTLHHPNPKLKPTIMTWARSPCGLTFLSTWILYPNIPLIGFYSLPPTPLIWLSNPHLTPLLGHCHHFLTISPYLLLLRSLPYHLLNWTSIP